MRVKERQQTVQASQCLGGVKKSCNNGFWGEEAMWGRAVHTVESLRLNKMKLASLGKVGLGKGRRTRGEDVHTRNDLCRVRRGSM